MLTSPLTSARNWLGRPAGVFSLADAERVDGECTNEALAYAAYFAARNSLRLRLSILLRCLAIPVREFLASVPTDLTSEPKTV